MKKSILSLIAGAIVALASCSQSDEIPGQPQEGEQLATFTIQTPATTRADVTSSMHRFIVEAYEGSSATGEPAARVEADNGTLTLGLKKNTEYTFLFWADGGTAKTGSAESSGYWNTADLKAVTVTSGKENENGEVAYCFKTTFNSADFNTHSTVTLRNATAQVNFIEKTGLTSTSNTLAVTYSAGVTLNVGTGKVSTGTSTITHTFTGIGQISSGATLATDYILAPKDEQQMLDLTIKLNTEDPKPLTNVPFEQCFKTNITGEYSSLGQFTFTVTADDTWEKPDNEYDLSSTGWDGKYPADVTTAKEWLGTDVSGGAADYVFEISTAKQLCAMQYLVGENATAESGNKHPYSMATYKLTADINLNNHSWTPIGKSGSGNEATFAGVFDGQGHTISGLNISRNDIGGASGFFYILNGTVKHLMVKGKVAHYSTGGADVGGIASCINTYSGIIAFCSFEGTVSATASRNETRLGWICGKSIAGASAGGSIISCFAKGTISGGDNVLTGGITGINTYEGGYSGTISGCTWYYKSGATPEGIAACYSGWTSGSDTNASYSTDTELANRVSTMNQNATNYDYQWEVSGSTLKLVPKSTN